MSGTQMMLVIAGLVLFSILAINVNRSILNAEQENIKAELIAAATNVGKGILNEITSKSFDEATISAAVTDISLLTDPGSLDKEAGEVYPNFNDVDDFHNYSRTDSLHRVGVFVSNVKVNYVNESNFNQVSGVRTWVKEIKVGVYNPYISDDNKDTVYVNYYKSY